MLMHVSARYFMKQKILRFDKFQKKPTRQRLSDKQKAKMQKEFPILFSLQQMWQYKEHKEEQNAKKKMPIREKKEGFLWSE